MSLPTCRQCGLPVLELEGEFAKLDSMLLGDGGPPSESAGWWHARCLVASGVADAWRAVRLRGLRDVRGYMLVAEMPEWTVLRHPRSGELIGLGRSGVALSLSRLGGRPRRVDGGAVYSVVDDEYNLELDDADTIGAIAAALAETGRYPLSALTASLGVSERVNHPEALAGGALQLDKRLRQYWSAGAVCARAEYGVFVPDVLLPYVPAGTAPGQPPSADAMHAFKTRRLRDADQATNGQQAFERLHPTPVASVMSGLSIRWIREPDESPRFHMAYDETFVRAVAVHAGIAIEPTDGRLCDHVPARGFVLLHSAHPHEALAACVPADRDGIAARVVLIEVSRSRIFSSVLESLRVAAAVDYASHLAWSREPSSLANGEACGLYGLRSIASAIGATCDPSAGTSENYCFLNSAAHEGLPHLLADYLGALASSDLAP